MCMCEGVRGRHGSPLRRRCCTPCLAHSTACSARVQAHHIAHRQQRPAVIYTAVYLQYRSAADGATQSFCSPPCPAAAVFGPGSSAPMRPPGSAPEICCPASSSMDRLCGLSCRRVEGEVWGGCDRWRCQVQEGGGGSWAGGQREQSGGGAGAAETGTWLLRAITGDLRRPAGLMLQGRAAGPAFPAQTVSMASGMFVEQLQRSRGWLVDFRSPIKCRKCTMHAC